jgi:DNA-binding LytR/AlgR family response regulator
MTKPTALIADDEPLLRESLSRLLAQTWPELVIVAEAKNGRLAVEAFEALKPDICFLDIHMPGLTGLEAARFIGRRAHIVFVTAFDQYALQAFDQAVLDYLVKPVELPRLNETVRRLKERIAKKEDAQNTEPTLEQLEAQIASTSTPATSQKRLRWLRVSSGKVLKMVAIDEVDFFRSDEKYTLVAWHDADGTPLEGLIRMTLRELIAELNPETFAQIHRSVVVNLTCISEVVRHEETATLRLKRRADTLHVSRTFSHLFKMM